MRLVFLTLCGFVFSSSAADEIQEKCYGRQVSFPFNYAPSFYKGPLYFTPSNGGPRRVLMENGEVKEQRLQVEHRTLYLKDLRVEDEGHFSVTDKMLRQRRILTLKVLDCANEIYKSFGVTHTQRVPQNADFLEFIPSRNSEQVKILWNRTKNSVGPVREFHGEFYWENEFLTQKNNGFYNFRQKDKYLISRFHLIVEESEERRDMKAGRRLHLKYPLERDGWTVTFRPERETEFSPVVEGSRVSSRNWFDSRIDVDSGGIEIYPLEPSDTGFFKFFDEEGNLALVVELTVEVEDEAWITYVAISAAVMVLVGVPCCCCYCRKRRRNKRAMATPILLHHTTAPSAAPPAAPPAVFYHGRSQPPSYTPVSAPPTVTPSNRSTHVSEQTPLQRSVDVPPVSSAFLTSDAEIRFEVKGMTSSLPLSSDSHVCDVYDSDKLTFL